MGSARMTVSQALFVLILGCGLVLATDWELENFGIRTSHLQDELLNKVAPNAPRLESRRHRFHHRRPESDDESAARKLRLRDRNRSLSEMKSIGDGIGVRAEMKSIGDSFGVRARHRGRFLKPSVIENDKTSSSLVRSKPSFAKFKAEFMEQLIQPKAENTDQTHLEKDMIQDQNPPQLAPLVSSQEPIVKLEGHEIKESTELNVRPRHKVRIRQRAGPGRQSASAGARTGGNVKISSRRDSAVSRQANRRTSQPEEISSNEIADVDQGPRKFRLRMKRPPMFKASHKSSRHDVRGRPRSSHSKSGRDSPVIKSIKKMRIRGRSRGDEDSSEITEAVTTLRPRLSSRRKASLTSQSLAALRRPEVTTGRLASSTRRQSSEVSSTSTVTPVSTEPPSSPGSSKEAITVSPAAHIIRYTLDSSEVTSELSTKADTESQTENLTPRAEKLVASMAIPSDIFSLATHTLMKHTSGEVTDSPSPPFSEAFLPTFRPKKKRGRFILAATSHGK